MLNAVVVNLTKWGKGFIENKDELCLKNKLKRTELQFGNYVAPITPKQGQGPPYGAPCKRVLGLPLYHFTPETQFDLLDYFDTNHVTKFDLFALLVSLFCNKV